MEDIGKLLNQEIREKKQAANGIHGRVSRLGRVGKVITPSDLIKDRKYKRNGKTVEFNIDDILNSSVLRGMLIEKLENDYENRLYNSYQELLSELEEELKYIEKNNIKIEVNDNLEYLEDIVEQLDKELFLLKEIIKKSVQVSALKEIIGNYIENQDGIQEQEAEIINDSNNEDFEVLNMDNIDDNNLEGKVFVIINPEKDIAEFKNTVGIPKKIKTNPARLELSNNHIFEIYDELVKRGLPMTGDNIKTVFSKLHSYIYSPENNVRRWSGINDFLNDYKNWKNSNKN